jgi:RNA polymerase sigma-B factor
VIHAEAPSRKPAVPARATIEQLLLDLGRLPTGDPGRGALRARAIEQSLPFAHRLARRYTGRGEPFDDLTQVAALALIKAVDGFDPTGPYPFVSYAIPTIVGALKRHFRDTTWAIRVPRSSQELLHRVRTTSDDLTQRQGRHPSTAELADHLKVTAQQLHTAAAAGQVYHLPSLDTPGTPNADPESAELKDRIGGVDPRYADIDDQLSPPPIRRLTRTLPEREQRILALRFTDEMTQANIAAEVGLSQMHVSRLLRHSLTQLRDGLRGPTIPPTHPSTTRTRILIPA